MEQDATRLGYIALGWRHTLFCHVCGNQTGAAEPEVMLSFCSDSKHHAPRGNPQFTLSHCIL